MIFLHLVGQALREVGDEMPPEKRAKIEAALRSLKQADVASAPAIMRDLIRVSAEAIPQAYRKASSKKAANKVGNHTAQLGVKVPGRKSGSSQGGEEDDR